MTVQDALKIVGREPFIPDTIWVKRREEWLERGWIPISRSDDPQTWQAQVNADEAVVTQIDDGVTGGGMFPTSSCPAPSIAAEMLEYLNLEPGHRVLEIGTGTGWMAALLATVAGTGNVTSVEIQPEIAQSARTALDVTGFGRVAVVIADGEHGHPAGAPYDRILSTAAVHTLPYPWVEQTTTGGFIVTPWAITVCPGALARFTVTGDGAASGRFVTDAAFMTVRGQRIHPAVQNASYDAWQEAGEPEPHRFGVTVTPKRQVIWLDEPGNVVEERELA